MKPATTHTLKTWPEFFQPILDRVKTFEIRWDDRAYDVGDFLHLKEWDPGISEGANRYTGRECLRRVVYLTRHPKFVLLGHVVMGLGEV